jgi:hypothetical protein
MSLAEGAGMLKSTALNFVDRHELNMGYHFEGTNIGYVAGEFKKMGPYKLTDLKKYILIGMLFMMKRLGNNLSWKPRPTQDDLSLGQP